jgi:predicted nucleic acid-binding Zn ribbon protein
MKNNSLHCAFCGAEIERGRHGSQKRYCGARCGWNFRNQKRRGGLMLVPPRATPAADIPGMMGGEKLHDWLLDTFDFSPHELVTVNLIKTAANNASKAAEILEREGVVLGGRPHPAVVVYNTSVATFQRLIRQLHFPVLNPGDIRGVVNQ